MEHFQADLCSLDSLFLPQFKKKKKNISWYCILWTLQSYPSIKMCALEGVLVNIFLSLFWKRDIQIQYFSSLKHCFPNI